MYVWKTFLHRQRAPWQLITHVRVRPDAQPDTDDARKVLEHIRAFANSDGVAALEVILSNFPARLKYKSPVDGMRFDLRHMANQRNQGTNAENKGLLELGWMQADETTSTNTSVQPRHPSSRLFISTRGICSWRDRLKSPETQWKRKYSAFETAVSWERAARTPSGLPKSIERLFVSGGYLDPRLSFAVAEHKVELTGGMAASQQDVWAVVDTSQGFVSSAIEAKAKEPFGDLSLGEWMSAGESQASRKNRNARREYILKYLPAIDDSAADGVRYQLLHRCASAVIEAERLGHKHAAFIVQAFNTPKESFEAYKTFCQAIGIPAGRGGMHQTKVRKITLAVGWADCRLATDRDIAVIA